MAVSITFGRDLPSRPQIPHDRSAFRILVLGDLGAARSHNKPRSVDRDDLDDVIKDMGIRLLLRLQAGGPECSLTISEFEDFHPDRLYQHLHVFETLRNRRSRLNNDATCAEEIAAIRSAAATAGQPQADPPATGETPSASAADLLSQVLTGTEAAQKPLEQQVVEGTFNWDAWVGQLVAPWLLSKTDPRKAEVLASVDSAIAETMRQILHHPEFQRIEAAWSGVRALTRRLETDRMLQLSILHMSREELFTDLLDGDDLTATRLHRLLVDSVTADENAPWSLVIGDFQFGMSVQEACVLARLGKICAAAGAVFVSGAAPGIAGCSGFGVSTDPREWTPVGDQQLVLWNTLRSLPEARHLSLVVPRLMARRPYGEETDAIEAFPFHELPDGTRHDQYAWMNGAFGIACLLGQAFSREGWNLSGAVADELDRWPFHVYVHDGDDHIKPCSEAMLSERAAETLAGLGLTVLRSLRDDDGVRVAAIRTLASDGSLVADQF